MKNVVLFFVKFFKLTGTYFGNYYQKGELPFGLTKVGNSYYFFTRRHTKISNTEHFIEEKLTNSLLKPGIYKFNSNGEITNPNDPRFPNGIPSQEELNRKLEEAHKILKESRRREDAKNKKANHHYKLSEYQLSKCEDFKDVLKDAWVRRVYQDKLSNDAKNYFGRVHDKKDLINYIRHQCSNYELYLSRWNCYTDDKEYYHYVLKKNYIVLIGNVYNNLQGMCNQMINELDKEN